jgi:hypothetical protein
MSATLSSNKNAQKQAVAPASAFRGLRIPQAFRISNPKL